MPKENLPEESSSKIPEKLLDLVKNEETALEVARICFENEIKEEEKIKEIGYQTGRVLLGDLPPEKFLESLVEKVKLSSFLARKISQGINEVIFSPVKENLDAIYKKGVAPSEKPPVSRHSKSTTKEESEKTKGVDTYREPIEE
jgi:hypothetical protein